MVTYILAMLLKFSLNSRVPVVFHIIVRPSWKLLRNVRPSITMVLMHGDQDGLFIIGPLRFLQAIIQMIYEAFATLLPHSSWQVGCDLGPFLPIFLVHSN